MFGTGEREVGRRRLEGGRGHAGQQQGQQTAGKKRDPNASEAGVQDAASQAGILHRCQNLRGTDGKTTRTTGPGRQRWKCWGRPDSREVMFRPCPVP